MNTVAGQSITPARPGCRCSTSSTTWSTTDTSTITVSLGNNPGSGTLSGTFPSAAIDGVATFSNLSINRTGTGYTLDAADGSLPPAFSSSFNITPAAAHHLDLRPAADHRVGRRGDQPGGYRPGARCLRQPGHHQYLPRHLDFVPTPAAARSAAPPPWPPSTASPPSATCRINKAGSGYTLTALDGALRRRHFQPLQHHAGGRRTTWSSACSRRTAVAGAAISPAVKVQVLDAFNNLVTTDTLQRDVAIGANPGSGTLSGTLTVRPRSAAWPPSATCPSTRPAPATR